MDKDGQFLTVLQKTPCLSVGADIQISEEGHTVYRLLQEKTSDITLALKYINGRKVEEHADVD